jgi:hypothetical protein
MLRLHGLLPLLVRQYNKSLLLFMWGRHGTGSTSCLACFCDNVTSCLSLSVDVHVSHVNRSSIIIIKLPNQAIAAKETGLPRCYNASRLRHHSNKRTPGKASMHTVCMGP